MADALSLLMSYEGDQEQQHTYAYRRVHSQQCSQQRECSQKRVQSVQGSHAQVRVAPSSIAANFRGMADISDAFDAKVGGGAPAFTDAYSAKVGAFGLAASEDSDAPTWGDLWVDGGSSREDFATCHFANAPPGTPLSNPRARRAPVTAARPNSSARPGHVASRVASRTTRWPSTRVALYLRWRCRRRRQPASSSRRRRPRRRRNTCRRRPRSSRRRRWLGGQSSRAVCSASGGASSATLARHRLQPRRAPRARLRGRPRLMRRRSCRPRPLRAPRRHVSSRGRGMPR